MCESAKNTKAVQGPSQQVETYAGHISTYYYLRPRQGAVTWGPGTVNNWSVYKLPSPLIVGDGHMP